MAAGRGADGEVGGWRPRLTVTCAGAGDGGGGGVGGGDGLVAGGDKGDAVGEGVDAVVAGHEGVVGRQHDAGAAVGAGEVDRARCSRWPCC